MAAPYRCISLEYEIIGAWSTARITLRRPEAGNCINSVLAEEFRDACQRIAGDDACRLALVTAVGSSFSVGRLPLDCAAGFTASQLRVADSLAALPVPVIVALNGDAVGQGLEMALAGDLRIAVADAQFALWESGKPSFSWDGGTQRLPRLIGPAWALDLALTGRRLSAAEALHLGLVNRVAPATRLEAASRALAEQVLDSAPIAARYAKEAVTQGLDLTLAQGMRLEADLSVILHSSTDRAEGIASFNERRRPKFTGG